MKNITEALNMVIDHIEKHLCEDINQSELARVAGCSYYDVGRMFSLIADINISDYIRKRRLTLAAFELKYDNSKVIDVAIKYGYDSPVSFARAFQAFHGFNPSAASKGEMIPRIFPRMVYRIQAKEVIDMIRKEYITINGKEYEASYFGESEMASWSADYIKRQYWRIENAYDDFKGKPTAKVLPYNNYPPINIEPGQVFMIDYHKKDGRVERRYYIADGTVWQDMPSTREVIVEYQQALRIDRLTVAGKEYNAGYYGEEDISSWSNMANKREFWRLENIGSDFENCDKCGNVLPYHNYPSIKIEPGQVFVIDYHKKDGTVAREMHIADGTVWQNMLSTRQLDIKA